MRLNFKKISISLCGVWLSVTTVFSCPEDNRTRASASSPGIGQARYELYKIGFERISDAMSDGYYLDAICTIESLLADRLESRLTYLDKSQRGFLTLGTLRDRLSRLENNVELKRISNLAGLWARRRNKIHEVMKINQNNYQSWEEKQAELKSIAEEGFGLLRTYDKALRRVRLSR